MTSSGVDATINAALLQANSVQHRVDKAFGDCLVTGNASALRETDEVGEEDVLESSLILTESLAGVTRRCRCG